MQHGFSARDAMYILVNNKTYTNLTQLSVPSEIVMEVDEGATASTMRIPNPLEPIK